MSYAIRTILVLGVLCIHLAYGMSGLNCWGRGPFNLTNAPDNPPLFMRGNPINPNMWASLTMPTNFTVAFIGDQGTLDTSSVPVLKLIKNSPLVWEKMVNDILGDRFPYFALIGNHDCVSWAGKNGYQQLIYDRLNRIGADVTCFGEVGINMVCSYKGITFVMSSYGTTLSSCIDYCSYCPFAGGHAAFIERAFQSFPGMWRVCAWHKNHRLFQVGDKPVEVGLPMYDLCRRHGAIIATAHEHSYCRSHLMADFENQTVASTNNTLNLGEGRSFTFVSGIAGWHLRPFEGNLYQNPWWASTWSESNNGTYGALFCKFNLNGELSKGYCYTKFIDGRIADSFFVETDLKEADQQETCATTWTSESQIDIAGNDVEEDISTGKIVCATDDPEVELSAQKLVALRFVKVQINSSAAVTEAFLEFTASQENSDELNVTIWAEKSSNAAYIQCDHNFAISNRTKTNASVVWERVRPFGLGGIYRSSNVAAVVNEVIALPGWKPGNTITFILQGTGGMRVAKSYEGDRCGAPTLLINTESSEQKLCHAFVKPAGPSRAGLIALIVIVVVVSIAGVGGFLYYFNRGRYQKL